MKTMKELAKVQSYRELIPKKVWEEMQARTENFEYNFREDVLQKIEEKALVFYTKDSCIHCMKTPRGYAVKHRALTLTIPFDLLQQKSYDELLDMIEETQ